MWGLGYFSRVWPGASHEKKTSALIFTTNCIYFVYILFYFQILKSLFTLLLSV